MEKTKQIGRSGKVGMLLGQAGVFAVASQLCLRGHIPHMPAVDCGVDIVLENGLRLQVKVAHITYPKTANYPDGAYCFNLRRSGRTREGQGWKRCDMRTYEGVADYFVLWGIEENRFFIAPTNKAQSHLWFGKLGYVNRSNNAKVLDHSSAQRLLEMENRWDLLDTNYVVDKMTIDFPSAGTYPAKIEVKERL